MLDQLQKCHSGIYNKSNAVNGETLEQKIHGGSKKNIMKYKASFI